MDEDNAVSVAGYATLQAWGTDEMDCIKGFDSTSCSYSFEMWMNKFIANT